MTDLSARIASLSPKQRELLARRLEKEGLAERGKQLRTGGEGIARRRGPGPYPLSFGQQRLWFIDRLARGSPAYNIPFAGRLAGPLDAAVLQESLGEVVRRQEALRTRFIEHRGQPAQVVDGRAVVALPIVDLAGLAREARESELTVLLERHPGYNFDLARGPVWRVHLVRLAEDDHALLVTMHHIITDAWSMAVFFRELPAIYDARRRGAPPPLPAPSVQVADHALWERRRFDGGALELELDFWRRQLAGAPTVLDLPFDRPRPQAQTLRGRRYPVAVPGGAERRLRELQERRGATLFMALLAAFYVLLHRYSGQDDLLVGSPFATREPEETHGLIGFFINITVLRGRLGGRPGFRELLERVREMSLATLAHQEVPFDKLVDTMGLERDPSRPPLVQVYFVLQNVHIPRPDFEEIEVPWVQQTDTRSARVDLTFGLWEGDGLDGWLEYNTDLFDRTTIGRMARHFNAVVAAAAAEPERPVDSLPILTAAEERQLAGEWNDTATAPVDKAVHELFAEQAALAGDAVAVVDGEASWTYSALGERAAALGRRLRSLGAGPEAVAGVLLESSFEAVAVLLAVLEAGGAYLPLDPDLPRERLAFLLGDAGARVLVTRGELVGRLPALDLPIIDLARPEPAAAGRGADPPRPTAPLRLAYVMYTSGSTGRPKGIAVPHRAVVRLVRGASYARFGPGEVFLQLAPLSFDAATFEVWGALLNGGRLVMTAGRRPSIGELAAALERHRVTTLWLTAGLFHLVVDENAAALGPLRQLLAGGDALSLPHVERLLHELPECRLVNGYGPTEGTTFTCCHPMSGPAALRHRRSVPVGRPIPGTRVRVLDRRLEVVPAGVHGELCLGGLGTARGYAGRPALTAASFVPDPGDAEAGERLYRTGDLVRHLADGTVDFLGRLDGQVKLRGFRVEPGEIEAMLAEHEAVLAATVTLRRNGRRRELVAWTVPRAGADPVAEELRDFLGRRLPEYMVPAKVAFLDSLPLTPNGKVDRAALGRREPASEPSPPSAAPGTAAEKVLAGIWADVLGVAEPGVDDDFFAAGGDSILAIELISRAAEAGYTIDIGKLFEKPTIAALADAASAAGPAPAARSRVPTGEVPLTPVQRWFFELTLPEPRHWNMAVLLAADRRLDPARLESAVAHLVAHHDMLRARFTRGAAGWRQEVAAAGGPVPFAEVDLARLDERVVSAAVESACAELQGSLDLAAGPLVRAASFDLGLGRGSRLLMVVHHLVVDGVSWRVLLADLGKALDDLERGAPAVLPAKSGSFREWAERLADLAGSADVRGELAYWRRAASPAAPGLPLDFENRGPWLAAGASEVEVRLEADATRSLVREVPEAYRTRVDDLLLAALVEAFAARTGERLLELDLEGHGRDADHGVDVSRTVGWFTTIYPVRLDLAGVEEPGAALKSVKEQLRGVPRRGLSYGLLRYLDGAEAARELAVAPRPEVAFNYLGQLDAAFGAAAGLRLAPESPGPLHGGGGERPHLLEITAFILDGELRLHWIFSRDAHRRSTVERLASDHLEALRALVRHCLSPEAGGRTPSDFPRAQLDQEQLDRLMAKLGGG